MFKLDPNERITIPEILSHSWLKASSSQHHYDVPSSNHHQPLRRRRNSNGGKKSPAASPHKLSVDDASAEQGKSSDSNNSVALPPIIITQLKGSRDGSGSAVSRRGSFSTGNNSDQINATFSHRPSGNDGNEISSEGAVHLLPEVHAERRVSLNSKILQRLYSPQLDLPKEILAPKSVSTKETSFASISGSKSILVRLNRTPRFSNSSSLHNSDADVSNRSWRESQRNLPNGSSDNVIVDSEGDSMFKSLRFIDTKPPSTTIPASAIRNNRTTSGKITDKTNSSPL